MKNAAITAAALAGTFSFAPAATADESTVLLEWNQQLLQSIRETSGIPSGYPGPVSRCIAIVYASIYDAVNSVHPTHEPYLQLMKCPPGTSVEAAAATAAHQAMTHAYSFAPLQQPNIDALYSKQMARIRDGKAKSNGIALGMQCANAIYAQRLTDGSDAPDTYESGVGPGHWVPTWPDETAAATPHWPFVTPWCMETGDQFRPDGTCGGFTDVEDLLASPEYAAQYNEVKELGALFSETRTEYETETAFFWANCRTGTYKPPGHMLHIAQVLAEDFDLSLPEQARLFALTALAMADAAIAAWDTKYAMDIDLWRPITAIWEAANDGNPLTEADPGWLGLSYDPSYGTQGAFTPPFPAWVSGHATFGASTAAVWARYFGTDAVTFTITSDDAPGVWRTFHSFADAALENGRSRVYFGVHFQWDSDAGYDVGTALGDFIATHYLRRLGDLDGNNAVDASDLAVLLGNWGGSGDGDLNYDGTVGPKDLGILLGNWG